MRRVTDGSANITDLHVEFGSAIDTSFALTTIPSSTADPKLKVWNFVFGSPLSPGNTVDILGYAWTKKKYQGGKILVDTIKRAGREEQGKQGLFTDEQFSSPSYAEPRESD